MAVSLVGGQPGTSTAAWFQQATVRWATITGLRTRLLSSRARRNSASTASSTASGAMPRAEQSCMKRDRQAPWVLRFSLARISAQLVSRGERSRPGRTCRPDCRNALPNRERTVFQL